MFSETVTLILKHSDISTTLTSATASSSNGSWSNGKQKTSWNVNLKVLLGNLWNKYDTFLIRLNQVSYSSADFPATNNIDQQVVVTMSGLPFFNSTYNQATGLNNNKYQMLLLGIEKSRAVVNNYAPNVSVANFKKSSENVEITIELLRATDGLAAAYGAVDKFPHMCYSFDIIPISQA